MQGEINVTEIMGRVERLRVWCERQHRDAEWVALKQWWNAEKKMRAATTDAGLQAARAHRSQTAWMYQAELERAWPKWAKAQRDRQARRSANPRHRPTAVNPSTGLPA